MSVLQPALPLLGVALLLALTTASHVAADGDHEEWGAWCACGSTCGNVAEPIYRYRVRQCATYPCLGDLEERSICPVSEHCPVDGGWSGWFHWSRCSQRCGVGVKSRSRSCNSPRPANGGLQCAGNHMETQTCQTRPCPVDGVLSTWTVWTSCRRCDSRPKRRQRTCMPSQHGGANCTEQLVEYKNCPINEAKCPVDGGLTDWSGWGVCPYKPCTKRVGKICRRRSCTNPRVERAGADCEGDLKECKECTTWDNETCPVDGVWEPWGEWVDEGDICRRSRSCIGPFNGGKKCKGDRSETARNCDGSDSDSSDGGSGVGGSGDGGSGDGGSGDGGSGDSNGNRNDDTENGSGSRAKRGSGDDTDDTEHNG